MYQSKYSMADGLAQVPTLSSSGLRVSRESERKILFDIVVTEFLTASLFSLVATCIVSARSDGRAVSLAGPAESYLPSAPILLPQALPVIATMGVPPSILQSILAFHTRTAFATRLSVPAFSNLNDRIEVRGNNLTVELAAWNAVCGAILLAVHFLYEEKGFPDHGHEQNVQLIRESIKAIGNGVTPFVRSDSSVFIPGWLDYRRDVRKSCSWRVAIHHQNLRTVGVLHDISRAGLGLSTQSPMIIGRPVVVILQDGRQLDGTIVWANGLRCGVAFLRALDDCDPLIR